MTSKEKLDSILGIKDNQSIDSFLDDLANQTDEISNTFSQIDDKVKENLQIIDNNISEIQSGKTNQLLALKNMDISMKEVEELIDLSKKMFKHIYENIVSSDLLDPELVQAASKLLESIHINIAEFLQMYRDRSRFIEKIKVMIFQQEQKKELMLLKHKYDMEKLSMKSEPEAIDAENMVSYNIEDITRAMHQIEETELSN